MEISDAILSSKILLILFFFFHLCFSFRKLILDCLPDKGSDPISADQICDPFLGLLRQPDFCRLHIQWRTSHEIEILAF